MQWINVCGRIINFHNVEWIEVISGKGDCHLYVFHMCSGNNVKIQTLSTEQVDLIETIIEDLYEMSGVVEP